jgi:putative ABC transport system permease protein
MLVTFWQDIRYGLRLLVKNPGFNIIIILIMAMGIGANSALYSVINFVLLRPLPFNSSDRLVYIWTTHQTDSNSSTSYADLRDWRDQNRTFEGISGFTTGNQNLTGTDQSEFVRVARVTDNLFQVLGVKAEYGRTFIPEDSRWGEHRVMVLSHSLWRNQFGGDPSVVGRTYELDGISYRVVGIMPAELNSFGSAFDESKVDLWFPLSYEPNDDRLTNHFQRNISKVIARLKPGITLEQAHQEMKLIAERIAREHPDTNKGFGARVSGIVDSNTKSFRLALLSTMGAMAFVLVIACVNVTNLLLVRAVTRMREISIRTTLGATRRRLLMQLLTETGIVTLLACVVGIGFAWWGINLIVKFGPENIPRLDQARLNGQVLGFTLIISILTGILFGIIPALQASKANLGGALKESSRGSIGKRHYRLLQSLVVSQVGMAVMLLIGATLVVKSYSHLQKVDPGFKPDNILTFQLRLPATKYNDQASSFLQQLSERIEVLPGVKAVAVCNLYSVPIAAGTNSMMSWVVGRPATTDGSNFPLVSVRMVTPNYLSVLRIPLLQGRFLTEQDRQGSNTVVINQTFARQFFPQEDPIGKKIWVGNRNDKNPPTIVGVVGDIKYQQLGLPEDPAVYAFYNSPTAGVRVVARTENDPKRLIGSIKAQISALDSNLPLSGIKTMDQIMSDSLSNKRFAMVLLSILAIMALILAATGIYGIISHIVSQRTKELGIRMALGAQAADIFIGVLKQGLVLACIGVFLGIIGGLILARLISSILFEISTIEPLAFIGIPVLLTVVAILASSIPAFRALRVDPSVALRYE